ncbi:hypothetical protein ACE38W_09085 [Chitinophaga sp. Hz27]|uniref:hypothetical protein n=1 Tax=Chitinophaga sp. Hz27 TaxID=3347169 RepID=UPI0035DAD8D9
MMRSVLLTLLILCCITHVSAKKKRKSTITRTYVNKVYIGTGIFLDPADIKTEKVKRRSTKDSIFIERYVVCKQQPTLVPVNNIKANVQYMHALPEFYVIDGLPVLDTEQTRLAPNAIESLTILRDSIAIGCNPARPFVIITTKPDSKNKRQNSKSTTF